MPALRFSTLSDLANEAGNPFWAETGTFFQTYLAEAQERKALVNPGWMDFQPPTSGIAANGKVIFNWDQAAAQIARDSGGWGAGAVITYAFRTSAAVMPSGVSGFSQFTAAQIVATEEALRLWAEVANISFTRVGSGTSGAGAYSNSATILFGNYSTGADGASAFAYYPGSQGSSSFDGDVWINISLADNQTPFDGGFGAHTLEHEIGHAIGLAHPGNYDALDGVSPTYDANAAYWQDSRMFTVMSYFGSSNVGGSLNAFSSGPQLHDIAAAQLLYGANMSTRTGNTVYGFNSNTGHEHYSLTTGTGDDSPVFAIWDAGGIDTLDLSGYNTPSEIDLREEAFSSAGPGNSGVGVAIGNISIARGAVIENAIGGGGDDTMYGNAVANVLTGNGGADNINGLGGDDTMIGGAGNDTLTGGDGIDTASYALTSGATTWTRTPGGAWTVVSADGTDTVSVNTEFLHFTDRDVHLDTAERTFFGDGTTDILLRRTDGVTAIWNMNGATVSSSAPTLWQAGLEWSIQPGGDFNGDGRDDLFLRRASDGVTAIWFMNGTTVSSADVTQWQAGLEWTFAGIGDFNGDGRDDFVLRRNTDGVTSIWNMNGTVVQSAGVTQWQAGLEWTLKLVGDFDGDGKDDFLWRRNDGVTAIWQMNNTSVAHADVTSQQAGSNWDFIGVGDFNGDGRDDLLLRDSVSGAASVWLMNGTTVLQAGGALGVASGWTFLSVGDYNGDGRDDILLRHDSDGVTALWFMNGVAIASTDVTSAQAGTEWGII